MPLLSIIIPVYNVEKFLPVCLDSILFEWQEGVAELICVNDGSTDNSLIVLKSYQERYPFIQVINQENKGLSGARNAGLQKAKGKYVFFLDSDDTVYRGFINTICEEIDDNDILLFNAQVIDENNTLTHQYPILNPNKYNLGMDFYIDYLRNPKFVFICAWSKVYRRDFLLQNNLFFEEGILHEDNLFTPIACYYAQNVKVIDNYLYNYRIRENSITQNYNIKRLYDRIFIANKLGQFFLEKKIVSSEVHKWIFYIYHNVLIDLKKWNLSDNFNELVRKIDFTVLKKVLIKAEMNKYRGFYICFMPGLYVEYFIVKKNIKFGLRKLLCKK
jgi:glycosyltransferase involved in cell wall biosynthesis